MKPRYKFRFFYGVQYVAPQQPAPDGFLRCGTCGRAWNDARASYFTPAPSGRCPFEHWHADRGASYRVVEIFPRGRTIARRSDKAAAEKCAERLNADFPGRFTVLSI